MGKPKVAGRSPVILTLDPGAYFWCACGLSKDQPYCDGSHQGTEFQPVKLEVAEQKQVALCLCKQTQNPPYCDGSHTKITD
jgi:CDGSH-type Zn-finger protein